MDIFDKNKIRSIEKKLDSIIDTLAIIKKEQKENADMIGIIAVNLFDYIGAPFCKEITDEAPSLLERNNGRCADIVQTLMNGFAAYGQPQEEDDETPIEKIRLNMQDFQPQTNQPQINNTQNVEAANLGNAMHPEIVKTNVNGVVIETPT